MGDEYVGQRVDGLKHRGTRFTYATPESVLGPDDVLLIAGEVADVERFAEYGAR